MKHPTPEQLLSYLYAEAEDSAADEARTHLEQCPDCQRQVFEWQRTLGWMDQDRVNEPSHPIVLPTIMATKSSSNSSATPTLWKRIPQWLPWSLAAGVALTSSFLVGRTWAPSRLDMTTELNRIKQELRQEIAEDLREVHRADLTTVAGTTLDAALKGQQAVAEQLMATFTAGRLEDRVQFLGAIERVSERNGEAFTQLRDGLQNLAERTGGAFRETGSRLNALASSLPTESERHLPD